MNSSHDADSPQNDRNTQVAQALSTGDVHDSWAKGFRTAENEAFYTLAFDYIASVAPNGLFLDAGCGECTKSIELAKRGYKVQAVDFSEYVLPKARAAVKAAGFADRVQVTRGDLTDLDFAEDTFSNVLLWGVLMHVPNAESAIKEVARVTAPGGLVFVSEGNMWSLQAVSLRFLKRILRRERARVEKTSAGLEFWEETPGGELVTRQANIHCLINAFKDQGFELIQCRAGQFTELYAVTSNSTLSKMMHLFNNTWFRWVRWSMPAFANLLVFRKPLAQQ